MFDIGVTRFAPGLSNVQADGILSDMYVPDRIGKVHEYSQDFDQFVAGDWTQTLNAGTIALVAGDGGLLAVTTAVSAITSMQKLPANFQLASGFRAWCKVVAQIDAVVGIPILGLMNATATPFTAGTRTDGIYMLTDATGLVSVIYAVGGVEVTATPGVRLVPGAKFNFNFYYDGEVYASAPNGRIVYELSGPGVSQAFRGEFFTSVAFPGAVNLTPTIGMSATTAVARLLTVDAFYAAKDRFNINATPTF